MVSKTLMTQHDPENASDKNIAAMVPVWGRIGVLSFGGPAAQIALMHRIVVEERKWLTEQQFLNALNFCMLLPGPEAMQLATYAGWRTHGLVGGLIAGGLFVLPGALVMLILAAAYATFGELSLVQSAFLGIKAAVLVIVIEALIKVSKRALLTPLHYFLAATAFAAIFFLAVPYPIIVIAAALFGSFLGMGGHHAPEVATSQPVKRSLSTTLRTIAVWASLWWAPVALLWVFGAEPILTDIAVFFSKLAVVTFGGAYAVLAYMAQDVVDANGWLTAAEMVDGLGLAETTPGPLILVTQFVGFLAAEKANGLWVGFAGAAITLWVTFIPCFLWIFAGAPYIDQISAQPRLRGALSAITAAVVGVILNLSIWFALNVLFAGLETIAAGPFTILIPQLASLDWKALILLVLSGVLLLRMRWNMVVVLALAALAGILLSQI